MKPHKYSVNYEGSSGVMKSKVALQLTTEIHSVSEGRAYIQHLVSDYDSTMRFQLTHKTKNEKGKLPDNILTPIFLADPSHQVKVMSKTSIFKGDRYI